MTNEQIKQAMNNGHEVVINCGRFTTGQVGVIVGIEPYNEETADIERDPAEGDDIVVDIGEGVPEYCYTRMLDLVVPPRRSPLLTPHWFVDELKKRGGV